MTKAAGTKALTSLLALGLVAAAGDAYAKPAKPAKSQNKVAQAQAKPVLLAKAKTDAHRVVQGAVATVKVAPAASKTAEPPSPDALLASLSTSVNAKPKSGSVDALVAKACELGNKPVAKTAKGKKGAKLAYMRTLTTKATSLGFAPIMREGAKPTGDHMVVRLKDRPLPAKVVRKTVRAHRRDVTACHEAAAVRGKAPRGNVTLRFAVAASGKVARVKVVADGAGHTSFERCLESRIRGWQFPKGETETKVDYPVTLQ